MLPADGITAAPSGGSPSRRSADAARLAPPMPSTNMASPSAAAAISCLSVINTCPARTARPARPAREASSTVRGPIVGMSTRISWPGFGRLTATPALGAPAGLGGTAAAARRSMASVPSTPSMATTRPATTTAACPTSKGPSASSNRNASAISGTLAGSAPYRPRRPSPITSAGASSCAPSTRKPRRSKKRTTRERTLSSPPCLSASTSGRARSSPRSGRMAESFGRLTRPTITISRHPASARAASMAPMAPHFTQVCG